MWISFFVLRAKVYKLPQITLLFKSGNYGTWSNNDYWTDTSYFCTELGRTAFIQQILLFPLEILQLYYQMSVMTLSIVVMNSCCYCCWLSDYICLAVVLVACALVAWQCSRTDNKCFLSSESSLDKRDLKKLNN